MGGGDGWFRSSRPDRSPRRPAPRRASCSASMSRVTSLGAAAPGTSTAPITSSASPASAGCSRLEKRVLARPSKWMSSRSSTSGSRSRMVTSAPRPTAICAALKPTTPPPITMTLPGSTPGTPPSSTPRPPWAFSSAVAPAWIDMRPGHLAHRLQQRQRIARPGHGFIGDRGDARPDQIGCLFGIGRKVEVGVEHLPLAQHRALGRLRFLDLHHHFAAGEDFGRRRP
jgi:hypothetical protein